MSKNRFHRPIVGGKKQCSKCYAVKPIIEFHKQSSSIRDSKAVRSICKICMSDYGAEYRAKQRLAKKEQA